MKKFNLILCSLLFVSVLFGQEKSKSTKSSVLVSHYDDSYALEASFSEGLKEEVSDAIVDLLGKENAVAIRKGFQWEKYNGEELAYRFRVEKKRCEVLLRQGFLDQVEYEDLVDFCGGLKELMNGGKEELSFSDKEADCEENRITINGDLDLNLSGNSVKMKINEDVFSLNTSYEAGIRPEVERNIKSILGAPNQNNQRQSEWTKKSNDVLLYQFIIKDKRCEVFIDKTKMDKEEWKKLQKLGFSITGKVL